jgi:hypothetical protein
MRRKGTDAAINVNAAIDKAVGVIPVGSIAAMAHELAPYLHMTADEIENELKQFCESLYKRDGMKIVDGRWAVKQEVD